MIPYLKKLSEFLLAHKPRNDRRGAILFVAVGALTVLSILAIGAANGVLQELKLTKTVTEANTSWYAPASVMPVMSVVWAHDATPSVITLYDLQTREIPWGDKVVQVAMTDEQSKINIDKASKNILLRFPLLSGDENLVNAVEAAPMALKEEL